MAPRCCEEPSLAPLLNLAERGVPHNSPGHDVVHDYTRVSRCATCGGGVVDLHSHDCWDTGNFADYDMYWWWRIDPADMGALLELADGCPAPLDSDCGCPVHRGLGTKIPPELPPSSETPHEKVPGSQARVTVQDGVPRWSPLR